MAQVAAVAGFDLWPRNFHMMQLRPKKKKERETHTHTVCSSALGIESRQAGLVLLLGDTVCKQVGGTLDRANSRDSSLKK